MNKKQLTYLLGGVIVFLLLGFLPSSALGYLYNQPGFGRLRMLEAIKILVVIVTGGLTHTLRDKSKDKERGNKRLKFILVATIVNIFFLALSAYGLVHSLPKRAFGLFMLMCITVLPTMNLIALWWFNRKIRIIATTMNILWLVVMAAIIGVPLIATEISVLRQIMGFIWIAIILVMLLPIVNLTALWYPTGNIKHDLHLKGSCEGEKEGTEE